ncbi:hypothetical protein [Streptosporangium sp. LJ11]|uniref:hypothetical protein n=1 Tax=Streptosporangium sp. LJ11 TaxID=3436927 RepID=UPI003F7AA4AF
MTANRLDHLETVPETIPQTGLADRRRRSTPSDDRARKFSFTLPETEFDPLSKEGVYIFHAIKIAPPTEISTNSVHGALF